MKTSIIKKITLTLTLIPALALTARADDYHWIGATSGTWDANFADNWYNDTSGTTSGTLPGVNNAWYPNDTSNTQGTDYITIGSGNDLFFNINKYNTKGLTVESGATITFANGDRYGFNDYLKNFGTLIFNRVGTKTLSDRTGSISPFALTNTGTILATGAGVNLVLSGSAVNTGGLIRAENGAAIDVRALPIITGGTVSIGVSSTFYNSDVQITNQATMQMNNVEFANAGHLYWTQANGDHNKSISFNDGVFTNSGTVTYLASGTHTNSTPKYYIDLALTGQITAVNTGVMTFRNIDGANPNRTKYDYDEYVRLTVNLSGTGSFANSGYLELYNDTNGDASTRTQYTALTVNDGAKFTNTGTINVSLGANTLDDTQHYAALTVSTDWTNHGTVLIDGADQTAAYARLDLGTKTYTAAAGSLTELARGAQIKAGAVSLSGTIKGAGAILAATTVDAGGVLAPTGTLALTGLTVNADGTLEFDGDTGSFLHINGDVNFTGGTLSVSNIDLTTDNYLLADYTGSLLGDTLTLSGLDDAVLDFTTANKIYLIAIPEPSLLALLLTGAALLATLRRRRK
ncbi:MAG: PEP-CTERM sorting domain-containing protein [Verrucomicrobiales bacterium]|jgi:hypothetical protein|nr:PEP-CTERM sorting domain-containing protein [Verrucomicrobiales bacterium]